MKDEGGRMNPALLILHPSAFILPPVVPDGIEPPLPGCRPGVVAVGPRDQNQTTQVDSPGIAPGFPTCEAGVFLLDDEPDQRMKHEGGRMGQRSSFLLPPSSFRSVPGVGIEPTASWVRAKRHYQQQLPRSRLNHDNASLLQVRGEGVEPSSPGSKPGSLPLADPRSTRTQSALRELNPPHQLGRLAPLSLGQGHNHKGGRRGSRTLKAHRSTVFETAAIAHWLALPYQAAAAGIEPAKGRLIRRGGYQHRPHRNKESGRRDLNPRSQAPRACAIPGFATPRQGRRGRI
jgi:hypothetical protein